MSLLQLARLPESDFLKRCYRFVAKEWPHCEREDLPDRGFERRFREKCVEDLPGWQISDEREFYLGSAYMSASGVMHEVDIVAIHPNVRAVAELKNRTGSVG